MKTYKFIIVLLISICFIEQAHSKTDAPDSSLHPYRVHFWLTGSIIAVGTTVNYLAVHRIVHRPDLTDAEINGLNKGVINSIDTWALNQDPFQRKFYTNLSDNLLTLITALPAVLLFDGNIRQDWFDLLLMYWETMAVSNFLYEYSFLGPTFQGKFRPIVYYDEVEMETRKSGANRNSFYSGHTASSTAASFFLAKVYCDYHPELGGYKYLIYTAAAIPPLIVGYIRMKGLSHFPSDIMVAIGVGALCGVMIPEFHRIQTDNISLSLYSSYQTLGIAVNWQPDFLK